MTVRIVTDSTADLPAALAQDMGIVVVPLNVHFDDEVFTDGVTIHSDEFYQRLVSSSNLPKTSQPAIGAFMEAYQQLLTDADGIVSVHVSSQVSGTVNAAQLAVSELGSDAIEVVDTDSTRGRGLMARKCFPDDWGMLFVFPEERSQAFYMANTPRSLDIMYFAADSTFINAAKYTTPNSLDNVISDGPAQFVVETPAGFVDRHGLAPGDHINWTFDSAESLAESEETPVMDSSLVN